MGLVIFIIAIIALIWNVLALITTVKIAPANWLMFWLVAVLWLASGRFGIG